MGKTNINYCDATWNVTGGCSHCSDGCKFCWAEQLTATRYEGNPRYTGLTKDGKWTGKIKLFRDRLEEPLHWKKPRVIFVNSQSDLFHPKVPFEFLDKVFDVMSLAPQHKYIVLTKRAKQMLAFCGSWSGLVPNIFLGLTICNQKEADDMLPDFLKIPGRKWLSIEPCLEGIELEMFLGEKPKVWKCLKCGWVGNDEELTGGNLSINCPTCNARNTLGAAHENELKLVECYPQIDQIVVGGESGPKARPMHPRWARSIRDQCAEAGVPFYFKQWGQWGIWEPIPYDPQKRLRIIGTPEPLSPKTILKIFPENAESTIPLTGWAKVGEKKAGRLLDHVLHNDLIWRIEK